MVALPNFDRKFSSIISVCGRKFIALGEKMINWQAAEIGPIIGVQIRTNYPSKTITPREMKFGQWVDQIQKIIGRVVHNLTTNGSRSGASGSRDFGDFEQLP